MLVALSAIASLNIHSAILIIFYSGDSVKAK